VHDHISKRYEGKAPAGTSLPSIRRRGEEKKRKKERAPWHRQGRNVESSPMSAPPKKKRKKGTRPLSVRLRGGKGEEDPISLGRRRKKKKGDARYGSESVWQEGKRREGGRLYCSSRFRQGRKKEEKKKKSETDSGRGGKKAELPLDRPIGPEERKKESTSDQCA